MAISSDKFEKNDNYVLREDGTTIAHCFESSGDGFPSHAYLFDLPVDAITYIKSVAIDDHDYMTITPVLTIEQMHRFLFVINNVLAELGEGN